MKTALDILPSKRDQRYAIRNVDRLISIQKKKENVLTIRKTKGGVTLALELTKDNIMLQVFEKD
jgi:hypothetical protein